MKPAQLLVASSSTIVQYYNYALFGIAGSALSKAFCGGESDAEKLLNFFMVAMVGVMIRPVSSIILGGIGDFRGRKYAICLTGIISSLACISIFFIPNYSEIGLLATILLLLSRMVFIAGFTGETDGIRLYIAENLPPLRQGFGNGILTFVTQLGALSASIAMVLLYKYSDSLWVNSLMEPFRLCFLFGGVLGLFFAMLRLRLPETSEFRHEENHPSSLFHISLTQIFNSHSSLVVYASILFGAIGSIYQFYIIFLPQYLKIQAVDISYLVPYTILSYGIGGLFWGWLSGYLSLYRIITIALFLTLCNLVGISYLMTVGHNALANACILSGAFANAGISVPAHIYLKNKMNIALRYRVFSLGHSLGSLAISAPTLYICLQSFMHYGPDYIIAFPICVIFLAIFAIYKLESH